MNNRGPLNRGSTFEYSVCACERMLSTITNVLNAIVQLEHGRVL